jgi:hypothetical protein
VAAAAEWFAGKFTLSSVYISPQQLFRKGYIYSTILLSATRGTGCFPFGQIQTHRKQ